MSSCCGSAGGAFGFVATDTPSGEEGYVRSIRWVDLRIGPGGDGTELSPFDTPAEAIAAIPDGGTVMAVGGDASAATAISLGSKSLTVHGLGGQDASGGQTVVLPLIEYEIATGTQRLVFHNVSLTLAHTGADNSLTELHFHDCPSVSLLADGDAPTVCWRGDTHCSFSGSGGPASLVGGTIAGYAANASGAITLSRAHVTGNITTGGAVTIGAGCTFGAGVTITSPTITIDPVSRHAAVAAGVTFSSAAKTTATYAGDTIGYVLTYQSDGTWMGASGGGGFSLPGGGKSGQVLESDGAGGATWATDDTGSAISLSTDVLMGRDSASTGNFEEITLAGGLEFTGTLGLRRSALTGDVTASAGSNATTISANAVTDAKLRDSAAYSIIGRSSGTSGDPADIVAGADTVLGRSGSGNVLFTQIVAGMIAAGAVTLVKLGPIASDRLLGRDTASAGAVEELTVGGGVEFTGAGGIQSSAYTGDVTKSAGGTVLTIANDAVTYAKLQNISATSRFLGRITASAGDAEELTGTQATSLLDLFSSTLKGLVPLSGGGTANFLRADGTWSAPSGSSIAISTDRLMGRDTAGTGAFEEITVGGNLEFTGSLAIQRGALTGAITAAAGSGVTTLTAGTVVDASLRNSAAYSVIGRAAGTAGTPTDIVAGTDTVLGRNGSGSLAFGQVVTGQVAAQAITYAKIQNVSATNRFLGRITALAGSAEELTGTQATSLLDVGTSALKGLAPASGGGTTNYLRADFTWGAPPGTAISIATDTLMGRDTAGTGSYEAITVGGGIEFTGSTSIRTTAFTGDVTKTAGGTALTIAANAVTLAQMAQVATARILGRVTAATGNVESLTGTQATTLLDTFTTALKGLVPASGGGTTNYLRADGTFAAPPGTAVPGGSTTQLQYNNAGAFDGASGITVVGSETGLKLTYIEGAGTAAGVGVLRTANNQVIAASRGIGAYDVWLAYVNASDQVILGDATRAADLYYDVKTGGSHVFRVNAGNEVVFNATSANFQNNNLVTTGTLSLGTTPATSYLLNLANNTEIGWKHTTTGDVATLSVLSDNAVRLGNNTNAAALYLLSAGGIQAQLAAGGGFNLAFGTHPTYTVEYSFGASSANFYNNPILFGSSSAASGYLRFPAGTADLLVVNQTSDRVVMSFSSTGPTVSLGGTTCDTTILSEHILRGKLGANDVFYFEDDGDAAINAQNVADASAKPFLVRASGSTSSNNAGGQLQLSGGRRAGTGSYGGVALRLNQDDSTYHTMVDVAHISNAVRVVGLCTGVSGGNNIAGDKVVFVGTAATAPPYGSAPNGGGILYVNAVGCLVFVGPGGTSTEIAAA